MALALGDRRGVDPALRDRFARTGTAHLLAISGLHVGCFYAVVLAGLIPVLRRGPWPLRWKLEGHPDRHGPSRLLERCAQEAEVHPLEVLHDDRGATIDAREVEHLQDVTMPEHAEQARLVAHATGDILIVRPLRIENLDGNHTRETVCVHHLAQVDGTKPSSRHLADEVEAARGLP